MDNIIKKIEELMINMWPLSDQKKFDGWTLNLSMNHTFKANAIFPLNIGMIGINEKIQKCENYYKERRFDFSFRITPFSRPDFLDKILELKGYKKTNLTNVLILDLLSIDVKKNNEYILKHDNTDDWLQVHQDIAKYSKAQKNIYKNFHKNIKKPKCMFSIKKSDKSISCGLGILRKDLFGIFDIKTNTQFQKKGFGSSLIQAMLFWAKNNGARCAQVSVDYDNEIAHALYSKLGFQKLYHYWFRIQK